jgi:hypothetical protein
VNQLRRNVQVDRYTPCAITAAVASMPDPPNSGSTVMPRSPRLPSFRKSSTLNFSFLLNSSACGSTSFSTNSRSMVRREACSSVGLYKSSWAKLVEVAVACVLATQRTTGLAILQWIERSMVTYRVRERLATSAGVASAIVSECALHKYTLFKAA